MVRRESGRRHNESLRHMVSKWNTTEPHYIVRYITSPESIVGVPATFTVVKRFEDLRGHLGPEFLNTTNTYILLDGLVCSIVGYFYESRRILASP